MIYGFRHLTKTNSLLNDSLFLNFKPSIIDNQKIGFKFEQQKLTEKNYMGN